MSIDYTDLLPVARRLVVSRMKDVARRIPRHERGEFYDREAESLAYSLAEIAQERIDELRAEVTF